MTRKTPEETIVAMRSARMKERGAILDIAIEFNVDPKTVWNHTKDIPIRLKRGRRPTHDHEKVLKLVKGRLPHAAISERLGISKKHIHRLCRRYYGCKPSELARMEWKAAA